MSYYIDDLNYMNDPRTCARATTPMMLVPLDDNGTPELDVTGLTHTIDRVDWVAEVELPWRYEVCPVCDGRGKHVNPAIDAGGLRDDFEDDPDFRRDYLSGAYDIPCNRCRGDRVVPEVDWDRIPAAVAAYYREELREEAAYRRLCDMERRMGA